MIATKKQQKTKAIELMKKLDIFKPYIEAFEKENQICFFERFGGYYVEPESDVAAKIKEIETEFNCTVFAITHEYTDLGEMYSFLIVTKYKDDWEYNLMSCGRDKIALAYVWNKDYEEFSELGDVVVESAFGGLRRIA